MSDLSFEQMLDESFKTLHTGEVVNGKVIDVKEDQIILMSDLSQMVSSQEVNIVMTTV